MRDVAAQVNQRSAQLLVQVLEGLIQRFGSGPYVEVLATARKEFDLRRGRVLQDEELWEPWTQIFLEWYVLERPLGPRTESPASRAWSQERDARRAAALRALITSHRSLFRVCNLAAGRVELLDMLGGARFSVAEERALHGVRIDDIAEVRLIGFEDEVHFGSTFCFHPRGTREAILRHAQRIRREGGGRRDVVDYCAQLRLRCVRYRHVPAVRIYELASSTTAQA